jgi:hypothetical protein
MNGLRFVRVLTTLLVGIGLSTTAWAQGTEGAGSGTGGSGESSSAKPARVQKKLTLKLPDEYRSKDTDKDNQIGMYEWPKSDWANFRKLDLNGDGFLTPKELTRKGKSKRSGPVVVAAAPTKSADSESPKTGDSAASSGASEAAGPATTLNASDAENVAANFFNSTDKDGNGKVTEEEVQKSILVRLRFAKLSPSPSYPLGREEFVRLYIQATSAASK